MTSESVGSETKTSLANVSIKSIGHGKEPYEVLHVVALAELDVVGDIDGEPRITSNMNFLLGAIDNDGGAVIDGLKVEQDPLAFPLCWNLEICLVPHVVDIENLQAREGALDASRDEDLVVQGTGLGRAIDVSVAGGSAPRPNAIEALPGITAQLRARILGPRVGADFVGPVGVQRRRLDLVRRLAARRAQSAEGG